MAAKINDNIDEKSKKRLNEIIKKQQKHSLYRTQQYLVKIFALIEKVSKRSEYFGVVEHNKTPLLFSQRRIINPAILWIKLRVVRLQHYR